jgi:hypothetical protein
MYSQMRRRYTVLANLVYTCQKGYIRFGCWLVAAPGSHLDLPIRLTAEELKRKKERKPDPGNHTISPYDLRRS